MLFSFNVAFVMILSTTNTVDAGTNQIFLLFVISLSLVFYLTGFVALISKIILATEHKPIKLEAKGFDKYGNQIDLDDVQWDCSLGQVKKVDSIAIIDSLPPCGRGKIEAKSGTVTEELRLLRFDIDHFFSFLNKPIRIIITVCLITIAVIPFIYHPKTKTAVTKDEIKKSVGGLTIAVKPSGKIATAWGKVKKDSRNNEVTNDFAPGGSSSSTEQPSGTTPTSPKKGKELRQPLKAERERIKTEKKVELQTYKVLYSSCGFDDDNKELTLTFTKNGDNDEEKTITINQDKLKNEGEYYQEDDFKFTFNKPPDIYNYFLALIEVPSNYKPKSFKRGDNYPIDIEEDVWYTKSE